MTRRTLIATAAGIVLVAGAGTVALLDGGGSAAASHADGGGIATATAKIERRDLVETESVDGTLGYADERDVLTTLAGTLTWLPRAGATVRPDHRLFQVDGEDVYLLDGAVPVWRTLASGTEGADVLQLERNLRALGYDPYEAMTVDGTWDAGTTSAVLRWQEAHDLDETGSIEQGRVVFQPGARRIGEVSATLGGTTGGSGGGSSGSGSSGSGSGASAGTVMTMTSTRRIVSVELSPSQVPLAKRGARVTVELPSGDQVPGRIASVASVAVAASTDSATPADATVAVTIRLAQGVKGADVDQAPVTVLLERSRARDVLAIPTSALLARSGGGFGVELRTGGTRRVVPVQTGVSASGYVEISGAGLEPGMRVTNGAL